MKKIFLCFHFIYEIVQVDGGDLNLYEMTVDDDFLKVLSFVPLAKESKRDTEAYCRSVDFRNIMHSFSKFKVLP